MSYLDCIFPIHLNQTIINDDKVNSKRDIPYSRYRPACVQSSSASVTRIEPLINLGIMAS